MSPGCNKTYYGDIGRTYELELHRPREDLVPYVCLLTITAAGGIHGDLVQVSTVLIILYRLTVEDTIDAVRDSLLALVGLQIILTHNTGEILERGKDFKKC